MQVWVNDVDYDLFINGFIIEGIKDSWNGSLNKQCMRKINVSLLEVIEENEVNVKIRKCY